MRRRRVRRHVARLARFMRRPLADQWLALQAFALLGISRWQIKRGGLQAVQGQHWRLMVESPAMSPPDEAIEALRISWAINGVRVYTPWQSNCFPQAVTAQRLLQRRGIAATVYFGATVSGGPPVTTSSGEPVTEGFAAHAWVRCGETILTGGDVKDSFKPIVFYAATP